MSDIVKQLSDSDAGDIFLWLGGLLLLLGFVGKIGAFIQMPPARRNLAKITGVVLLAAGVSLEQGWLSGLMNSAGEAAAESEQATSPPTKTEEMPQRLDWVVVLGSHDTPEKAQRQREDLIASFAPAASNQDALHVIDTKHYSGLTDGFWAVIIQADNRVQAQKRLSAAKETVEGAYIKRAGS